MCRRIDSLALAGDRARPMRDNDRDGAAGAQSQNGAGQRLIAFGIEI